jgi:hypothetical protein
LEPASRTVTVDAADTVLRVTIRDGGAGGAEFSGGSGQGT